ncbi:MULTISPECIES: hypothetical protein [Bradyrhizobium]|uniref:hypothetical protein n=1 Tax=Bradyrhizobium TaxID=374 RepID=UPI00155E5DE8|nr:MULTISPECIES: hypothetical protein [Bradyrhizobium]UUO29631.1 hypothetical protein DCG74_21250 [Bradyrhizobium sp. WBAH42]UWU72122.1 hypothetical protein N2602_16820 [Bradyrhizobium sp. NC92]
MPKSLTTETATTQLRTVLAVDPNHGPARSRSALSTPLRVLRKHGTPNARGAKMQPCTPARQRAAYTVQSFPIV